MPWRNILSAQQDNEILYKARFIKKFVSESAVWKETKNKKWFQFEVSRKLLWDLKRTPKYLKSINSQKMLKSSMQRKLILLSTYVKLKHLEVNPNTYNESYLFLTQE